MRMTFLVVSFTALLADCIACNFDAGCIQANQAHQGSDSARIFQVHPIIRDVFYDLPLHYARLDLRGVIVRDERFISTDTTFNDYRPATFFKGITTDKGIIDSNPDSIEVLLVYGDAALITDKGGQADTTKHPMILVFRYFFANRVTATVSATGLERQCLSVRNEPDINPSRSVQAMNCFSRMTNLISKGTDCSSH